MVFWLDHLNLYRILIRMGVRSRPKKDYLGRIAGKIREKPELDIRGMKMKFDPKSSQDILIYDSISSGRGYEPGVTGLLYKSIKKGMTFIDVGANSGYYTLLAASRLKGTGKIISLEPQGAVYQRLKNNVESNRLENVKLLRKAAYSKSTKVTVGLPKWGDAETSIDYPDPVSFEEVDAVTIDSVCKTPDVMKIDVEGYELEVLQGASMALRHVKCMIFEQSIRRIVERNIAPNSVIDYVKDRGFDIYDSESGKEINDYRDASALGSNFYAVRK